MYIYFDNKLINVISFNEEYKDYNYYAKVIFYKKGQFLKNLISYFNNDNYNSFYKRKKIFFIEKDLKLKVIEFHNIKLISAIFDYENSDISSLNFIYDMKINISYESDVMRKIKYIMRKEKLKNILNER